jgi:RNA polymerase sigma-54 factor
MKMEMSLQQRLEQRLVLAPQIIQSIEILQLPMLELKNLVQKELQENPLIEIEETADEAAEKVSVNDVEDQAVDGENIDAGLDGMDGYEDSWNDFYSQTRRRSGSALKDRKFEAMQNSAAKPVTLQKHLENQLAMVDTSERIRLIATDIIYNIDSNGYLQYPVEEILDTMNTSNEFEYTIEEAEIALEIVRSIDPPGVGGRDLSEVLLLQMPNREKFAFERFLVENHLEDIEKNRLPKIVRDSGETMERIKESIEFLRTLSPKPGAVFSSTAAPYIIPDIVLEKIDGVYEIRLEKTYIPDVMISPRYRAMLAKHKDNPELVEYVKKKLESAHWLIRAIEQRRNTILRISRALVDVQEGFLEHGVSRMKPLKMQTIADKVGVHVSTVGRAISGKYIQTPRGIYPLKFFFTGGTVTDSGTAESTRSVKKKLADILDAEDKKHPLSDEDIVRKLKQQGLSIARRTVTKYRKAMNIPSSRQRREY